MSSTPQLHNLCGIWGTSCFFHDPADEVLVLLPNGTGIFEYWWWQLSFLGKFNYAVNGNTIQFEGLSQTQWGDGDEGETETTDWAWQDSFDFIVRPSNKDDKLLTATDRILELSKPLFSHFPHANKLGSPLSSASITSYELPKFK